jgi:hypothetical protein
MDVPRDFQLQCDGDYRISLVFITFMFLFITRIGRYQEELRRLDWADSRTSQASVLAEQSWAWRLLE